MVDLLVESRAEVVYFEAVGQGVEEIRLELHGVGDSLVLFLRVDHVDGDAEVW